MIFQRKQSILLQLMLGLGVLSSAAQADERQLPVSIGVKTLSPPKPPALDSMTPMNQLRPVTLPTLPHAKYPQYQLRDYENNQLDEETREHGTVLFRVGNNESNYLIEATIHIDGRPFCDIRRGRIKKIIESSIETKGELEAYELADSAEEIFVRYVAATGQTLKNLDVDEARWLYSRWMEGPELLLLQERFQAFRASQRPLFRLFDRDSDNVISAKEIKQAVSSMQKADANRDDVIDAFEISELAEKQPPDTQSECASSSNLMRLESAAGITADFRIEVNYDRKSPKNSTLTLKATRDIERIRDDGQTIRIDTGAMPIEFSAVQQDASEQVSIGAVIDGYPLLGDLDPNSDRRFSVRELRSIITGLKVFDTNEDGSIEMLETPPTLRVCFALGPIVHRELAQLRSTGKKGKSGEPSAPEWFMRMDQNRDGDLSRREFPGTDDQFIELDKDGDELVSIAEAIVESNNHDESN